MKLVHSESLADGYPLCMPVEYWEHRKFRASKDDSKVNCEKCLSVLGRMYREIGMDWWKLQSSSSE
jgi:hypothetical protein